MSRRPPSHSEHIVKTMDILAKALSDVLARVAADYALDHAELVSRYLSGPPPASLPQPKPQVTPSTNLCTAKTAKGLPCKYKPQRGSCVCKIHASKSEAFEPEAPEPPLKAKKKKASKKVKVPAPEHTHPLTEDLSPDNVCQLCDTHGSVLDPGMPEAEFELADDDEPDLAARLKAILSGEEDLAEDEDFEDDQVILARLKAITSSNSLTVPVAELFG